MSETRFSSIEKSKLNSTPSTNGSGATEKQVIQEQEQLLCLNLTITELQDNLASLKIQQNERRRRFENYRAAISPIRKLPLEILQTVFIQCLPLTRNAVMSNREAPLLLGRICRHWRQITYVTPQLWSSIHIVISTGGRFPRRRQCRPPSLEDISAWLHRSGALPLSISICFPTSSSLFTPQSVNQSIIQPYLATLAKFKPRWRSLHLSLPYCDWIAALEQFNATDLPLLERLYISGPLLNLPDGPDNYAFQTLRALVKDDAILQTPGLRSLGLPFYGDEVPQLPIRWENLTSLTILGDAQTFNMLAVRRTLMLCPNLMTCTLCLLGVMRLPMEDPSSSLTRIDLPNLQSISFVEDSAIGPTSDLLRHLHTPQLRHLSYEQKYDWEDQPLAERPPSVFLNSLSAFLGRLVVPLEELDLIIEDKTDVDVVGVLQLMYGLKRLSLRHPLRPNDIRSLVPPDDNYATQYYFGDEHLASLTPSNRQSGEEEGQGGSCGSEDATQGLGDASPMRTCPNLEVFYCIGASFSDAALLQFLHSRCSTSGAEKNGRFARLRKAGITVTLPKGGRESEDTRNQLKQLQAAHPSALLDVAFVAWTDPPPPDYPRKPFSPYDGLESFGKGW